MPILQALKRGPLNLWQLQVVSRRVHAYLPGFKERNFDSSKLSEREGSMPILQDLKTEPLIALGCQRDGTCLYSRL